MPAATTCVLLAAAIHCTNIHPTTPEEAARVWADHVTPMDARAAIPTLPPPPGVLVVGEPQSSLDGPTRPLGAPWAVPIPWGIGAIGGGGVGRNGGRTHPGGPSSASGNSGRSRR